MSTSPEANSISDTTPDVTNQDALPFLIFCKAFLTDSSSMGGCGPIKVLLALNFSLFHSNP